VYGLKSRVRPGGFQVTRIRTDLRARNFSQSHGRVSEIKAIATPATATLNTMCDSSLAARVERKEIAIKAFGCPPRWACADNRTQIGPSHQSVASG
jgi:hypothetical protein